MASNYVDFTTSSTEGWAQQYLPDLMEKEAEVFGNRTISGFLSQVGAEEAMTADRVIWSEQGRLHLAYTGTIDASASLVSITAQAGTNATYVAGSHGLRVGDTCLVASPTVTYPGRVTAVSTDAVTILPYTQGHADEAGIGMSDQAVTVLKYGSEWAKGSDTPYTTANEPDFLSFTNKPVILREMYHVAGSDVSSVGWGEVAGEDGTSGYLWYLKAEGETRARFTDYMEMVLLEAEATAAASIIGFADGQIRGSADAGANGVGTQGLFDAIETRGNVTSGITGVNAATDLADFSASNIVISI